MHVDELRHGQSDKPLPAPLSLLHWLTGNAQDVTGKGLDALSAHSREKRRRRLARDAEVIAEAQALLTSSRADNQWFVLEGPSYPDVFIGTPDLIVVIQGKRTESGPTTATTWMSPRSRRRDDAPTPARANSPHYAEHFRMRGTTASRSPIAWVAAPARLLGDPIRPNGTSALADAQIRRPRRLPATTAGAASTPSPIVRGSAIDGHG